MIPAAQDPTKEPDAGAAPNVSGNDRISATEASEAETIIIGLTPRTPVVPAPVPSVVPGLSSTAPTVPPVSPDVSVRAPAVTLGAAEIAGHRLDIGASAPVVRPVAPGTAAPVSPTPSMTAPPPIGSSATNSAPPPPPRATVPPPLPPGAAPPPVAPRKAAGPSRPPLSAQHYPMPSTIAPTEPVRKRSRFRSKAARSSVVVVFDGMMSLATIIAVLFWLAAFAGLREFETPGPLAATKIVVIPKKSRDEIGDILENAGVVSSGTVFVYGSAIAQVSDWKAGEYEFHAGETMHQVADEMQQNKVVQHKITFPEGWTSEQIVQRLIDDPVLTGKVVAIPEEGSLLPDTYTFPRGETRQQILDRMSAGLTRRLTDIWAHRNADMLKALKVPKDLVTLASIIEKETSKPDERPRIAAVFVNRLNRNMRLETDPTILYGLYGGKAWTEPRTITRADLAAPNPYNTYKINGLPPGPIANPGRASLEAAANPSTSNELFFVADGTGGHAFADTIEEHNKNVAKWREIERQRKLADPNAASTEPGTGTGTLAAPLTTPVTPVVVKPVAGQRRPKPTPAPANDPSAIGTN